MHLLIFNPPVKGTPHFQLCMGTPGGMAASPRNAVHFSESLPGGCTWSAFGVGREQFDMVAMAIIKNLNREVASAVEAREILGLR